MKLKLIYNINFPSNIKYNFVNLFFYRQQDQYPVKKSNQSNIKHSKFIHTKQTTTEFIQPSHMSLYYKIKKRFVG